jgi:hypothetical protein
MGYEVHITRKEDWFDETGQAILLSEWLAYIQSDPEMQLDGYAQAHLGDGSVLRTDDPSMAVWVNHPQHGKHDGMTWIWLSQGNIQTKNPDQNTLQKMWHIAQPLGARVQGDDGELYDANGSVIRAEPNAPSMKLQKAPWWRIW